MPGYNLQQNTPPEGPKVHTRPGRPGRPLKRLGGCPAPQAPEQSLVLIESRPSRQLYKKNFIVV